MGEVTIDSIQIEIESNSTNASKGLDALAETLQKLKKKQLVQDRIQQLEHFIDGASKSPECTPHVLVLI